MFASIKPTKAEIQSPMPGDEIVNDADVVMDRAFTVPGTPETVWPWINQLGKNRSGWYFPRHIESFIPKKKRASWHIEPSLQNLKVGSVIDDWGGRNATFTIAIHEAPHTLVHTSRRGNTNISWAITLRPDEAGNTRVQLRLRMSPVRFKWLADTGGDAIDALTIAGLAAGLKERLSSK